MNNNKEARKKLKKIKIFLDQNTLERLNKIDGPFSCKIERLLNKALDNIEVEMESKDENNKDKK